MTFFRLRAFGLDTPSRAMTANDNWQAPETLSVALDTWTHRYLGRRDMTIPLRELMASNALRAEYQSQVC
jgi:hypothetical protein